MNLDNNTQILLMSFTELLAPYVKISIVHPNNSQYEFYEYTSKGIKKIKSFTSEELINQIKNVLSENKPFFNKIQLDNNHEKIAFLPITAVNSETICVLIRFNTNTLEDLENRISQITNLINFNNKFNYIEASEFNNTLDGIKTIINNYCFKNSLNVFNLSNKEKKKIVLFLKNKGIINIKNSVPLIADYLKTTRATIYNYLKI